MVIKEESGLKFAFPDDALVIKFDDEEFYRQEFNKLPEAKGVDFLSVTKDLAVFVEVKNCKGYENDNRWRIVPNDNKVDTANTGYSVENRHSLDIEVSQKVAMTISALMGVLSYGELKSSLEELNRFAEKFIIKTMLDDNKETLVVLFLEGNFDSKSRSKKMIMTALQKSMQSKLKWLNCRVSVVDSETYHSKIFEIV